MMSEPKMLTADELDGLLATIEISAEDWDADRDVVRILQHHIAALEARIAELESMIAGTSGVNQECAAHCISVLQRCGLGAIGKPNTLWSMVDEAVARIAELEPLAEVGRLVEGMPERHRLVHFATDDWRANNMWEHLCYGRAHTTPTDALRALVGEKDG